MCNMRSAKEAVIGDTYHLKVRHSLRAGAYLVMGSLYIYFLFKRGTVVSWATHHFTSLWDFWRGFDGFRWPNSIAFTPSFNKSVSHQQRSGGFRKLFGSNDLHKRFWELMIPRVHRAQLVWLRQIIQRRWSDSYYYWPFYSCFRRADKKNRSNSLWPFEVTLETFFKRRKMALCSRVVGGPF